MSHLVAKSMTVTSCDCGCGTVYVNLLDDADEIFAVGPLTPEVAGRVGIKLLQHVAADSFRQLQADIAGAPDGIGQPKGHA